MPKQDKKKTLRSNMARVGIFTIVELARRVGCSETAIHLWARRPNTGRSNRRGRPERIGKQIEEVLNA